MADNRSSRCDDDSFEHRSASANRDLLINDLALDVTVALSNGEAIGTNLFDKQIRVIDKTSSEPPACGPVVPHENRRRADEDRARNRILAGRGFGPNTSEPAKQRRSR